MLTYALMPGINIGSDRFCHLLFILDIYYLLFILESLIIDKLLKLIFGHSNTHLNQVHNFFFLLEEHLT